jgi:GntR family transcriptional regulator
MLHDKGWVKRVPGSGTFVTGTRSTYEIDQMRRGHSHEPWETKVEVTKVEVLFSGAIPAPDVVARRLQLSQGDQVILTDQLTYTQAGPSRVRSSWVPLSVGKPLLDTSLSGDVTSSSLEHMLGRVDIVLEAEIADATTAKLLGLSPGGPVLFSERLMRLPNGTPVELAFSRYRGDAMLFEGRGSREQRDPVIDTRELGDIRS